MKNKSGAASGWVIALGGVLGAVFGVLAGNVGAWLAVGVAIGIGIGVWIKRKETACPECDAIHKMHSTSGKAEG